MAAKLLKQQHVPKVRIAHATGRPIQLRYRCPDEKREVRISTNTYDTAEAKRQKKELEAKLLLGIQPSKRNTPTRGPHMPWEEFRDAYTTLHLVGIRDRSASDAESRLDIAQRILKPRTLADVASSETLTQLQTAMLAGQESRYGRRRSPHAVKGYMGAVMAAMNWASLQGWIDSVPRIRPIKVSKLRRMKGRPITGEEFERMLSVTPRVVGEKAAESWRYLLRGLWSSALRIDELMHVSWDIPHTIVPEWPRTGYPVLILPAQWQKNDTEEAIPLLPWFEDVLNETQGQDRTGWVFEPVSLQIRLGRKVRHGRPKSKWVGKVISVIGETAGVVVTPANEVKGTPVKFASAHDLRRSCAERLLEAGVPPLVIARILRHASWDTTRKHYAPGDVQKAAGTLREVLCSV